MNKNDNSVYANEEEFEDYANEREKCVVMSIKSNNKDIAIDTLLLAAEAFSIGVGVLGTVLFGKDFIENIEKMNEKGYRTKFTAIIRGIPVVLSGTSVVLGVKAVKTRKEKLQKHLVYKKRLTKNLDSFNTSSDITND